MEDNRKTKKQLIDELRLLRHRVAVLDGEHQPSQPALPDASHEYEITRQNITGEALPEEPEDLSLFIQSAELTTWNWDIKRDSLIFNGYWAKMLGYTTEEFTIILRDSAMSSFQHPDDLTAAQQAIQGHLTGKTPLYRAEYRMKTKTGDWKWMLALGKVVKRDAKGRPLRMAGVNIDIHERKQMEKALRESEARNRATLEAMPDGVILYRVDGMILDAKQPRDYPSTRPQPYNEIIGKNIADVNAELAPKVLPCLRLAVDSGLTQVLEYELFRGDQKEYREARFAAIDRDKVVAIIRNISERKRAKEQSRQSEERYRTLLENIPGAVYRCDINIPWRITYISDEFETICGYPARDFMEDPARYFTAIELPEDSEKSVKLINTAIMNRQPYVIESRLRHADGSIRWVYEKGRAVYSEQGEPLWLDGVIFDITERKLAEEALRESELLYRTLMETVPGAVYQTKGSPAWGAKTVSKEIETIMGYSMKEFVEGGMLLNDFTLPEDVEMVKKEVDSAIAEKRPYMLEYRIRHKDGSIRWIYEKGRAVFSERGEPLCLVGVLIDSTERKQVAEALRESELLYRTLVETVPGVVYQSEGPPLWRIKTISKEIETILGSSMKEFLESGAFIDDFLLPEYLEIVQREIDSAIAEKRPYMLEYRIRHVDGSIRWVYEKGRAIFSERGEPMWLVGVLLDITERKQAAEALREKELIYHTMMETVPGAVYQSEGPPTWRTKTFTREIETILGYSMKEFVEGGILINDFTLPEDLEMVKKEMASAIAEKRPYVLEYRIRHADGSIYWMYEKGRAVYSQQGEPLFLVGVIIDITERKLAAEALRESELIYTTLVETIPGAVHHSEACFPWKAIHISREIEAISGYSPNDLMGGGILFNDITLPEDSEMVKKEVDSAIAEKRPYVLEYRIRHADGSIRWVYEKGRAVYSERDEPLWLDGVIIDINERKLTEEALVEAQKLARMGELVAGIAHEINSPLQVITGLSERITRQLENAQLDQARLARDMTTINRSGWNIAKIVRSLLTYARETSGQMAPHDLNELVKDTLILIEHQLRTWANINVATELADELPLLLCERNQIVQVIINLMINARDAMPDGGEITICTGYDVEGGQWVLEVADTGCGIPYGIQKKIFDPFFTTKPVGQGTGLGLSIVFGIVTAHSGQIEVKSAPNQGTTFTIHLPRKPDSAPQLEELAKSKGRY